MAMKAVWNGAISFGLVNIPVKLFSAVNRRPVSFRLLHEKDNSPIEYRRWCTQGEHEVPWSEVVKGIDLGGGNLYVMTKQDLASLRPAKSDLIEISQFVDANSIPQVLTDSHYFIGPERAGEKAFFLLRESLKRASRVAIGTFVMRDREYVAAIEAYGPGLLLTTLIYQEEIRDIEEIAELKESPSLKREEVLLAEQLIDRLSVKHLDLSAFKDTYVEKLKKAIKSRDEKHIVTVEAEEVKATSDENLIQALRASLEG